MTSTDVEVAGKVTVVTASVPVLLLIKSSHGIVCASPRGLVQDDQGPEVTENDREENDRMETSQQQHRKEDLPTSCQRTSTQSRRCYAEEGEEDSALLTEKSQEGNHGRDVSCEDRESNSF